ncbi:MAG: phage protein Gp27 family protein, partial [Burkholderia gladioli]
MKEWLDKTLVQNNFSDYNGVTAALNELLEPLGMSVSRSGVHQYGKSFDEKLKSLRMIAEQAR